MYRNAITIGILTLLCVSFSFFFLQQITFGATTDFTVNMLIGDDTSAPSIPINLTATPISTSQINLSWASSTDNVAVAGYHIWRDDILIATSTQITYSDTGLAENTLYTYYITAFDDAFNESASSTLVSTTTLSSAPPVTPPSSSDDSDSIFGSWSRPLGLEILSLQVLPQKDSVIIRYTTHGYIKSVIRWGKTSSYELGSLAENTFSKTHETKITGLTPGTRYYFAIEGENRIGRYGVMHTGTFVTLPPDDLFPPDNVSNLRAVKSGDDIVLTWENPSDPDFAKVRVVRNNLFYPSDEVDGWITYEGVGTEVRDRDAAKDGDWQFYTVFSYDRLGNISSGAVVAVYIGDEVEPPEIVDPTKNEISLDFSDILFSQEGIIVESRENKVYVDGAKHLNIAIPYDLLPEHLKTILVVLEDSNDKEKTFSFLLRINKDKTGYVGTLAPFGVSGIYPIQVSVFDFKTAQIGYSDGSLISYITQGQMVEGPQGVVEKTIYYLLLILRSYLFWFIVLLILLTIVGRRLMQANI